MNDFEQIGVQEMAQVKGGSETVVEWVQDENGTWYAVEYILV